MKFRRGFTLVETLCVCVILAILASILFPIIQESVLSARTGSAIERLRQFHVALMLYQNDYDGGGKYGSAEEMGLPDHGLFYFGEYLKLIPDRQAWNSPCGTHPDRQALIDKSVAPDAPPYVYYPESAAQDTDGQMIRYFQRHRENSVLLNDTNCWDHSLPLFQGLYRRKIIGVFLDGHVETRWTWDNPDLWTNWQ